MPVSKLYDEARRPTLKEVRALYPGCILETYFMDSETPERCLVVARPDAHADHWDILVVYESSWHQKNRNWMHTPRKLNTDRWKLLGEALFPEVSKYAGLVKSKSQA